MSEGILNLKKTFELNLTKAGIDVPTLQAKAAIDCSGSMGYLYQSGWVDRTVDLFIGAALKFDDNGELEIGFFNNNFIEAPVATIEDGGKYMRTKGKSVRAYGGTCFAPIIQAFGEKVAPVEKKRGIFSRMFGAKQEEAPKEPVMRSYVGIVTDGENSDVSNLLAELNSRNSTDTFYQFIGIGNQVNVEFLTNLSAKYDNVGFILLEDPTAITPDSFYGELCNPKFAAWVK